MPQIFIGPENYSGDKIIIDGEDYHHLKRVRRVRVNGLLNLRDHMGRRIISKVVNITDSRIEVVPLEEESCAGPLLRLTLCAGLLKSKKFDLVVQKCSEIGVDRIIPFISERTVSLPSENEKVKIERWRRIAGEASKQSMRSRVPEIEKITIFRELIKRETGGLRIIGSPGSKNGFREYLVREKNHYGLIDMAALLVGPEGGFSPGEIDMAVKEGWAELNFGFNQLRAETASIVLSSITIYELENYS